MNMLSDDAGYTEGRKGAHETGLQDRTVRCKCTMLMYLVTPSDPAQLNSGGLREKPSCNVIRHECQRKSRQHNASQ
jgi:hypothetical protein